VETGSGGVERNSVDEIEEHLLCPTLCPGTFAPCTSGLIKLTHALSTLNAKENFFDTLILQQLHISSYVKRFCQKNLAKIERPSKSNLLNVYYNKITS
jgi:hypothetical protein